MGCRQALWGGSVSSGLSIEPGEEATAGGPRGTREDSYDAEGSPGAFAFCTGTVELLCTHITWGCC